MGKRHRAAGAAGALTVVVAYAILGARASDMAFQTDFEVSIGSYAGLWYEAARTPNRFQDNKVWRKGQRFAACFNTTAEYTIVDDQTIRLRNRCLRESDTGTTREDVAGGTAAVVEGSAGRKLKLAFGTGIARFFQRLFADGGFDYWIYCLGPKAADGRYDWSVVSGPGQDFIFILTRDRFVGDGKLGDILGCARAQGLPVDKLVFRQQNPA